MTTQKKHILTSYERLSDELLEEFNLAFPGGYEPYATEVTKPNGEIFYAVRMECEDAVYLIRVELRTDKWEEDDDDEDDDGELEEDEKRDLDVADIDDVEEDAQRDDDEEKEGQDYDL